MKIISIGDYYKFNEDELFFLKQNNIEIEYIDKSLAKQIDHTTIIINKPLKELNESSIESFLPVEFNNYEIYSLHAFMEKFLHKNYIDSEFDIKTFFKNNNIKEFNIFINLFKRTIDIVSSIAGLILLILLFIPVTLRIKKESPGKIFFIQKRVGLNGKEFNCYKFRSMHENMDSYEFSEGTEDKRIFPFAQFLRKSRIDEFPQFLNVLKGEMSLIGPRPERKFWTDKFEEKIPFYNKRHLVKPGITGLAQVLYRYGADEEDAKQKLMYDLYYIKHFSLMLEFKIFLRTFSIIFNKKGR